MDAATSRAKSTGLLIHLLARLTSFRQASNFVSAAPAEYTGKGEGVGKLSDVGRGEGVGSGNGEDEGVASANGEGEGTGNGEGEGGGATVMGITSPSSPSSERGAGRAGFAGTLRVLMRPYFSNKKSILSKHFAAVNLSYITAPGYVPSPYLPAG